MSFELRFIRENIYDHTAQAMHEMQEIAKQVEELVVALESESLEESAGSLFDEEIDDIPAIAREDIPTISAWMDTHPIFETARRDNKYYHYVDPNGFLQVGGGIAVALSTVPQTAELKRLAQAYIDSDDATDLRAVIIEADRVMARTRQKKPLGSGAETAPDEVKN